MSLKILWHSAAPFVKTGYGNQTGLFGPRIARQLGHEVVFSATWGLNGAPMSYQGHLVLPPGFDPYGSDVIGPHAVKTNADIVITLLDAWTLKPSLFPDVVFCPYAPIDHDPIPVGVLDVLRQAYQPIAYSQFGFRLMTEAGLDPRYAPHATDTTVFSPGDQVEARQKLGIPPDVFLVGIVAANQERKAWPQQLEAVSRLMAEHSDAWLYVHANPGTHGEGGAAYDLTAILAAHHVESDRVRFAEPYAIATGQISDRSMATRYRAMSLLLNATCGEGFGLTVLEAAACGTPVISSGWAAGKELTFGGWEVPEATARRVWVPPAESWTWSPDPSSIYACLKEAYEVRRDDPIGWATLQSKARAGALEYEVGSVVDRFWKSVLSEIEHRLAGHAPRFSEVA